MSSSMRRCALTPLALAALLATQVVQAQTTAQVVVTGSPLLATQSADVFGGLSTTVGESQLRDLNAQDLSAALRRSPGVVVSRFNPVGSFGGDEGGAVYVRGLGASRPGSELKTYVDGIPFYMGVWNHALLDLLPLGGMERITVLKGPQPQRFGNSFAAIDLTPRRARQDGLAADLRLSAGSFSTAIEQAQLTWRSEALEISAAQGHAESDGHRSGADGRLDNGLVQATLRLSPQWQIGLLALGADNRVGDPGTLGVAGSSTGRFSTRGTLAALSLAHAHGDWHGRVQVYDNQGKGLWDNLGAAPVDSRFHLSGLRWTESLRPWDGGELLAGLDIDRMSGSVAFGGFTAFDDVSLQLTSPHLALAQTFALGDSWTATPSVGLRGYRHDVFGSASAPNLGVVLARGETLALRATASRGLSFPGLDAALLNAIVPPLAASPDGWRTLQPERMDHVELGAHWQPSRAAELDLALFEDRLKDRYVFAFPPVVALPSLTNLGSYRIRGAELTWQQRWSPALDSTVALTWLDPSLADLPYAPKQALGLGLNWREGPWRVSADVQAQSAMFVLNKARADGAANAAQVGGFGVLNLRVGHALPWLGPRGELFAALENLGDKTYAYRPGYPMPGRWGQIGLQAGL